MNELLNRAKESAQSPEIHALVADLECFIRVQEKRSSGEDVQSEWVSTREKLWDTFDKVASTYGIDPNTLKQDILESGAMNASDEETLDLIENLERGKKRTPSITRKFKTKV